jgi:guanylate kinase
VLEERLKGRGTETDEVIAKRLERAKQEFKMCTKYNYYVVNDDLEKAVEEIEAIIIAEKARKERNQVILEF